MRVELVPGEYVRWFWDLAWDLMVRYVSFLGGLGYVMVVLAAATVLVLVYRTLPGLRRVVVAVLAAAWIAAAVSLILLLIGGG
ncbi:MAG: hypothetical protein QW705_01730 [Zestosphaera sp.]